MKNNPLVGTWRVKTLNAPFAYHMFSFHSDGTMHQTNPPLGNKDTSDTAGLGVWAEKHGEIKARFEEYSVAYEGEAITRGVVDFTLHVDGDSLTGSWFINRYNAEDNAHLSGPFDGTLTGERVTLD